MLGEALPQLAQLSRRPCWLGLIEVIELRDGAVEQLEILIVDHHVNVRRVRRLS